MLEEAEKSFLEGVEMALEIPAYTEVDPITGDKSSVPLPQGEGHTDPRLLPPKEAPPKAIVVEGGEAKPEAKPAAKPDLSKRKAFAQWLDTNFKAPGALARTDEKRRAKLLKDAYRFGKDLGLTPYQVDNYINPPKE